jgi:hypothetical protein
MADGQYRIAQAQLPLLNGIAGHNFLVLLDPNGEIVGELHGMARDAKGKLKSIGNMPDDRLKSAEYPGDIEKPPINGPLYQPHFAQAELASGDQATIMNLWNAAKAAGAKLNERDIQYPWMGLGPNSNSFASTLIAAMGLNEPPMVGSAPIMPGARHMLLDPRAIQDIQRQFKIGAPRSENDSGATLQADAFDQPSLSEQAMSGVAGLDAKGQTPTGRPNRTIPLASPAVSGSVGSIGDGNGIGDWRSTRASATSSSIDPGSVRRLSSPILSMIPADPRSPPEEAGLPSPAQNAPLGLPGRLMQIGAFDPTDPDQPPSGGLLALLQDYMRNNPDGATKR